MARDKVAISNSFSNVLILLSLPDELSTSALLLSFRHYDIPTITLLDDGYTY